MGYARFPTQLLLAVGHSSAAHFIEPGSSVLMDPIKVDPPGSMLRENVPLSVVLPSIAFANQILQYAFQVPFTAPVLSTVPLKVIGQPAGSPPSFPDSSFPEVIDPSTLQPVWVKVMGAEWLFPDLLVFQESGMSVVGG
jgi:hypothetical protein